jgi:hypothetical protein
VDVLVLGEVPAEAVAWPAVDALLARGGGLVLLPTPDADAEASGPARARSPAPPDGQPRTGGRCFQPLAFGLETLPELLALRPEGRRELPPLQEVLAGSLRGDATPLLQDEARQALLSLRQEGAGRVVQVGAADTWRWRRDAASVGCWTAFWLETLGRAGGRLAERR